MTMRCWLFATHESVEIVKSFLNLASFVRIGSVARINCSFVVGLTRTREGSYLSSSMRNACMLAAGLNFTLARGGGEIGANRERMGSFDQSFLFYHCLESFGPVFARDRLKRGAGRLGGRHGGITRIGHYSTEKLVDFLRRKRGGLEF